MSEFKVAGHTCRVEPLSIFDQFDIARRVAPVITMLVLQKDREKLKAGFGRAFVSMSSGLSRDDGQIIMSLCLARVSRKQGTAFAPVQVNGQVMFEDIDMPAALEMIWHVLERSKVIDFFDAPASSSKGLEAGPQ